MSLFIYEPPEIYDAHERMTKLLLHTICLLSTLTASAAIAAPFTAGITALNRQHDATAFRAWKKIADLGDAEGQNKESWTGMHFPWQLFKG